MIECSCGEMLSGFDIDLEGRVSKRASIAATHFCSSVEDAVRFMEEQPTLHDVVLGEGSQVVAAGCHVLLPVRPEPGNEPKVHICPWPTCEATVATWGDPCARHVGGMTALTRKWFEQLDLALSFDAYYFATRHVS